MIESTLLPELIAVTARRTPQAMALTCGAASLSYAELQSDVTRFASGLMRLGLGRSERVAIYLEKRFETVIASFGATAAGAVFVPVNPLLKPEQVAFILRDCNVRVLVTSPERFTLLKHVLTHCHDLRHVVLTDSAAQAAPLDSHIAGPLALTPWQNRCRSLMFAGRVRFSDFSRSVLTIGMLNTSWYGRPSCFPSNWPGRIRFLL